MKYTLAAALLVCNIAVAEKQCPEPILVDQNQSCFITMPGCLKTKIEFDSALEGIKGCPENFPDAPCLLYMERAPEIEGGFRFHCGTPDSE